MNAICTIVIIVIICYLGYKLFLAMEKSNEEHRRKVETEKNAFNGLKRIFDENLSEFFNNTHGCYQDMYPSLYQGMYSSLNKSVSSMKSVSEKLKKLSKKDDHSETVNNYSKLAEDFKLFGQKVNRLPYTQMMDPDNYGRIQKTYWDSVRSMNKSTVDSIIANSEKNLSSRNYSQIFAIDVEAVLRCIWFYATDKPYSAENFKKAVNVFNRLVEKPHVEVEIAELYAMKQLGGEEVLRNHIRSLGDSIYTAEELTLIASALMWINAYQAESMILQNMLSKGMQMSAKTQERLHSLTNGGGKAPAGFNVSSNSSEMYFDVSALTWKDEEYTGLFENLAFQEKTLSYSLAVRDEDRDLFITNSISVPGMDRILTKLNSVFEEEYGTSVTAELKKCIALSGSGEENMKGILVESNECKQMGILVHVVRIGKKLNIKFYTLFMPSETRLVDLKQQVLSLHKKLSPSVTMWESSIKDTVLLAIQQLLNMESQTAFNGSENTTENSDGPIF